MRELMVRTPWNSAFCFSLDWKSISLKVFIIWSTIKKNPFLEPDGKEAKQAEAWSSPLTVQVVVFRSSIARFPALCLVRGLKKKAIFDQGGDLGHFLIVQYLYALPLVDSFEWRVVLVHLGAIPPLPPVRSRPKLLPSMRFLGRWIRDPRPAQKSGLQAREDQTENLIGNSFSNSWSVRIK